MTEFRKAEKVKWHAGRKEAESKRNHVALPEREARILACKPQPCDDT